MTRATWVRDGVLMAAAMAVGWWAHGGRQVEAASAGASNPGLSYQFNSVGSERGLSILNKDSQTIYVYNSAFTGNQHMNCSYKFHIQKFGEVIQRENCAVGSAE